EIQDVGYVIIPMSGMDIQAYVRCHSWIIIDLSTI
uniref:Hemagglutinin glycoprotein n=1 Tax=Strongyloides papillosus TaxID=174720 RepID=A0A0N5C5Y3_STREA